MAEVTLMAAKVAITGPFSKDARLDSTHVFRPASPLNVVSKGQLGTVQRFDEARIV